MSLFRTKEFWSNQCSNDEEYDQNSLKVSRISSDSDFVIIGSHSGFLRIYRPTGQAFGEHANYKPNDLYLEKKLSDTILQIGVGKLMSGSQSKQIAILQPRSLGIYTLISKDGVTDHGMQNSLNLVYEHKLRRSSANFTIGPFGSVQNRDFVCVQSLDGLLTFFEQETFSFCCFLPESLLPSPIVYVRSSDLFVTLSSDWYLKSYKYKMLSEIGGQNIHEETVKLDCFWDYNLGEGVIDIQTLYEDISRQNSIAVLGERNLFCFSDYGRLKFMKKLDFLPHCFLFYYLDDGKCMFLIVAETNILLLYQGTTLKWSAKLQFLPVAVDRGYFHEINGALVMLSEDGYMQFGYLGTEPNLFSAPPLKNRDIDFEKVEAELNSLNQILKANEMSDLNLANINVEKELVVAIQINPHLETCLDEVGDEQICCKASIEITPNALFEEVHLSASVQKPLIVKPTSELYKNLSKTSTFTCFIHRGSDYAIPSLELEVVVSFISSLGVPKICYKKAFIPLRLVYETCQLSKDGQHKITLNLNENSVPLYELFPEFTGENSLTLSSNAVTFKHFSSDSPLGTILAAKSSQRYRLQSDDIVCLNLLVQEVVRRLKEYYSQNKNFTIICNSGLPINECTKYMKDHFQAIQTVTKMQKELNLLSAQYRLIQKRLIAKFKQKNPTPLSNLDVLLGNTYEDISNLISGLETERIVLEKLQIRLSCVMQLVANLINFMDCGKTGDTVNGTLSTGVNDYEDQSWEDVIDASLCFLLRTSLAKSEKDKLRAPHTSFEEIKDISKFEKHFVQVLERTSRKTIDEIEDTQEEVVPPSPEEPTTIQDIPNIGTEFATASTRALSARHSLLRRRHKVE